MANKGTLELKLINVQKRPIVTGATVTVGPRTPNSKILTRKFKPFHTSAVFTLPARPQVDNIDLQIDTDRYRRASTGLFHLNDGGEATKAVMLARRPSRWSARFTRLADMSASFQPFKDVLARSPKLRVNGEGPLPNFDDGDTKEVLWAKAASLNLFAKLSRLKEPVDKKRDWIFFRRRAARA